LVALLFAVRYYETVFYDPLVVYYKQDFLHKKLVDFNTGAGIYNLDSSTGNTFILKLDKDGNFIWARNIGGGYNTRPSIALDNQENIIISGDFRGTWDFDPGANTFNLTSTGKHDIFITKLDFDGNFIWAKNIGGALDDIAYSTAIDINDEKKTITVDMTLSTPGCPVGDTIIQHVQTVLEINYPGYTVTVNLVWEPQWTPELISEEGRAQLNQ